MLILVLIGLFFLFYFLTKFHRKAKKTQAKKIVIFPYVKRQYLFDTNSEFRLFNVLLELYGEKYHIFPQINYIHLVRPRRSSSGEEFGHRSRVDRKSADFVFCDKEKVVPLLVIELDGYVHGFQKKQRRDIFIDETMRAVGLPLLRLKTNNLSRDFVKEEVDKMLVKKEDEEKLGLNKKEESRSLSQSP